MIRTSDQINEISEALARAQAKFGAALKGSVNPAFRSKYADLSSVIDATLEHLNAEGITCMQHPALTYAGEAESREAMITVTTRLQHKSGQFMESDLSIPAVQRDRFDAQSCGSAITYACRYALQSICLVPREDDDGNAATGTGTREAAQAVANAKLKNFKETGKLEQPKVDPNACLFYYAPPDEEQIYITGDNWLLKLNKDILQSKGHWSQKDKAVLVPLQDWPDLQHMLEQAKCPLHRLEAK